MRKATFAATILAVAVLLGSPVAMARPGQNEIPISAACGENGETYDLIVVAEGQSLKPVGEEHFVVLRSEFDLFDAQTGEPVGTVVFDKGKKKGLEGDLLRCEGTVTTTLFRIGEVRIEFAFEALVT